MGAASGHGHGEEQHHQDQGNDDDRCDDHNACRPFWIPSGQLPARSALRPQRHHASLIHVPSVDRGCEYRDLMFYTSAGGGSRRMRYGPDPLRSGPGQ
jgi:hypothetical protein